MRDRSCLFPRRMFEGVTSATVDSTMSQEYSTPETNEMTSLPSSYLCSLHSHPSHTGCEHTVFTAQEAHEGPRNLLGPAHENRFGKSECEQSSTFRPGLYSQNITTKLKSTWCPFPILFYSSIMPSSHIKSPALPTLLCLLMVFLVCPSSAFNLDLKTAVVHEGQKGSMFGFAVAQHVDQSTNWLLIGAPKAETRQQNLSEPGAVYRCKTDRENSCQQVPFDTRGNNIKYVSAVNNYLPTEQKSYQWFGATVESSGESGVIVACAPRYIYFGSDLKKREPVGMCWVAKTSTTEYERYSPCSDGKSGFERQGFCQAGFSAALSDDGRRLMIAAPGSWYWQGQLYNFKTDEKGRVFAKTPEGDASQDNTYKGYSSAMGRFDGDSEYDYVVGIPKGDDYVGMIEIYTQNMNLLGSISGDQLGSYFGASVAVADLNQDGLDDIIVGAPFFGPKEQSKAWETGRVYIFYQTEMHTFVKSDHLDGFKSQSRFGMAVSRLGDINFDGPEDLCVGAPYGGKDMKGVIYIYLGAPKGIRTDPSQTIHASDFNYPLASFGSSISAGIDQDGNEFPDVLVGAYESDMAVFMRTRPIVYVNGTIKLLPPMIHLDNKSCVLNGTNVTCILMKTCFTYDGRGLPKTLYFDFKWTIDFKTNNNSLAEQRAFFNKGQTVYEKKAVRMETNGEVCTSFNFTVRPDPVDKLSPIVIKFEYKLNTEEAEKRSRRKRDLKPILNYKAQDYILSTAKIAKNCGGDEECVPDLYVSPSLVTHKHIAGDRKDLEVKITVGNNGEDSFNSKLFVEMPYNVDYSEISIVKSEIVISCDPSANNMSNVVICDLGNPMTSESKSSFTFKAKPTDSIEIGDFLKFSLHVNSSNPEVNNTYFNNHVDFQIPVEVNAQIKLLGSASPEKLNVTEINKKDDGKGKLITHVFELKNTGLSLSNETRLQVAWPSTDRNGKPALTLDGGLITKGIGKCNIIIITPNNASTQREKKGKVLDNPVINPSVFNPKGTNDIRCTYYYCTYIQCLVAFTHVDHTFVLTVNSRLKVGSFLDDHSEIEDEKEINLVSVAHASVLNVPYNLKNVDKEKFPTKRLDLVTTLSTEYSDGDGQEVPAWIYPVGISVGILLLLIIILLLWCCGFFKRKKPKEEEGYFAVNGKNDIDNKYLE